MIESAKKPSIHVHTNNQESAALQQLLFGMEEEGIPFMITEAQSNDVIREAHTATLSSPLLVGAALINDKVAIHYRNLPPEAPLFYEERITKDEKERLRKLGSNAARLVKGIAFD